MAMESNEIKFEVLKKGLCRTRNKFFDSFKIWNFFFFEKIIFYEKRTLVVIEGVYTLKLFISMLNLRQYEDYYRDVSLIYFSI